MAVRKPKKGASKAKRGGKGGKGGGNIVSQLSAKDSTQNPEALAAWIGRQKYGDEFPSMAVAGRRGK
jgi:hypothetical protein